MSHRAKSAALAAAAIGLALGLSAPAQAATTFMDQIGPNGSFATGLAVHSQTLEPANASFNDSAVDNFTLAGDAQITEVQAVFRPFGGGTYASFGLITDWQVSIYSSIAAATASQAGDVAAVHVAPTQVTVSAAGFAGGSTALVTVPLNLNLSAGAYWLAVIPRLDLATGKQLGVPVSSYAGTPSDNNGFLANPGGGGGFANNRLNVNDDLAYRVSGNLAPVPEPATWLMWTAAAALLLVRRRQA